ncbi:MAG: transposase [Gammaproteobacteria bacterium]|nr:transposase [Gammaproteobacteria bacterium]
MPQFLTGCGTEAQCAEALCRWRWPNGFVCRNCHHTGSRTLQSRALFQCPRCHHRASRIAGSVFAHAKLPLTTWFLAMYRLTWTKNGVSALELPRQSSGTPNMQKLGRLYV